ncbi:DUF5631 domain-containing protein [Mycobacterium spongiae]|uniref:Transmembrane protein n=1 Tax=Mycobacterium spongiae TaxID=886343 RepID=A0A975PX60_9MYCO|nr:DUF5632 domain-containing protein [Mycobacterium spongiae]QUR67916.1 hypothetical protein F6B93_13110 [Mycobacterium spongiae]
MPVDLPPGKWSAWLVGAWWPARPDAPTSGVGYWRQMSQLKRNEAANLRDERSRLAVNQGRTAEDLMERYLRGEQRLATIAEQCEVKSEQSDRVADAVNHLRDQLTDIARSGNEDIDRILDGSGPTTAKLAAVNLVIQQANARATNAGAAAMSNIVDATQRVLDATVGGDARSWLLDHGVSFDAPPPPPPLSAADLDAPPAPSSPTASAYGEGATAVHSETAPDVVAQSAPLVPTYGDGAPTTPPASPTAAASGAPVYGDGAPTIPAAPPPGTNPPPLAPGTPAAGVSAPSGAGISAPAASTPALQSLSESFTTGMATGAPAAAGAHSVSAGTVAAASEHPPPTVPPATAPLTPASTVGSVTAGVPPISDAGIPETASEQGQITPPTSYTTGGVTAVAPVVTGGTATGSVAPVVGGGPAGPLPAYGSDLRPPVVAPPAPPSPPAGPVSGAAVASPASSSPSAGGSVLSPATKSTGQESAQAQATSGSSMAAASATAMTGAAAGDRARRSAEQQRLQRIVEAVARQEPGLSWAAGLRDDGRTTLLVTDLAGGWIPPHIRLPAHVTLLEPTLRRRDARVVDLLGTVTMLAVHQPHGYIGDPDKDAPKLTGDRTARAAPPMDELGPTLAEYVRRRDGLPRVAQAVAVAAARNYGVPDNEADVLSEKATEIRRSVLAAYPSHDFDAAIDWMLLAAINTLVEGDHSGANYHLAWAIAATSTRRSL